MQGLDNLWNKVQIIHNKMLAIWMVDSSAQNPYWTRQWEEVTVREQTITPKMADQGRTDFCVVFTMGLCAVELK